ncbi:hypothetical protein [Catenulispora rubra]|uniref:hypothetical protein n=1 Tax=Catenulispora rubra TaxID=280293 RepID=UPI00189280BA|nr:hypothetical protein [Catenulispora rubra]
MTTQDRSAVVNPSVVWMCGLAMVTMAASSTTISWHAAMTASATPGRAARCASGAPPASSVVAWLTLP